MGCRHRGHDERPTPQSLQVWTMKENMVNIVGIQFPLQKIIHLVLACIWLAMASDEQGTTKDKDIIEFLFKSYSFLFTISKENLS